MHAYAFKDPVFFALNDQEQKATGGALGQFCVSCHSPIGMITRETEGMTDPTLLPEIVQHGVSCEVCHTMRPKPGTQSYERSDSTGGRFTFDPGDRKYGPMDSVVENTFHRSVQDHSFDLSAVCLPCHNIELRGVRLEGTFDEWNESPYSVMGRECQDCHMPEYSGQAATGGPQRASLHHHDFTGVDVAVTDFPGRAAQEARVAALLKDSATLLVDLPGLISRPDTLAVRVYNGQTGHSLPSGTTFERQMWLEVTVTNDAGDTLFVSGNLDANGDLRERHSEIDSGDAQLKLWTATIRDASGDEHVSVFRATSIEDSTLRAFATGGRDYSIPIPKGAKGNLRVVVRLLFRAFAPYILRERGVGQFIPEVPIFEMERFEGVVALTESRS